MAFLCDACNEALTTKPNPQLIPIASSQVNPNLLDAGIFTPCGHVFHLGCICENWLHLQAERKPPVCPNCSKPCTSNDLTKLYPVIRSSEQDNTKSDQSVSSKKAADIPTTGPADSYFSIPHTLVAFLSFAITLQLSYYVLRNTNRTPILGDDVEDEDVTNFDEHPPWVLQFYTCLAVGALLSFWATIFFDYRSDEI